MERRAMTLTEDEINHVNVAYDDDGQVVEDSFVCVPCSKALTKATCAKHMTSFHSDTLDVGGLPRWATVKDGNLFRHKRGDSHRSRLLLTRAMFTQGGVAEEAGEGDRQDGDEGWGGDDQAEQQVGEGCGAGGAAAGSAEEWAMVAARAKAAPSAPSGGAGAAASEGGWQSALAAIGQQLVGIREDIAKATAPRQLEFDTVTLQVSDLARDTEPAEKKYRGTCPRAFGKQVDAVTYDGFETYLEKTCNQEESTRQKHQLGIKRLLNIITVQLEPDATVDFKAYLVTLYKGDVLDKAMDLPIMDLRWGWARDIVFALDHLVDFGIYEANRMEQGKAKWCLEMFQSEVIHPWKNRAHNAKRLASVDKQEVDGLRLEKLPPVAKCKQAVHDAFCDLAIIAESAQRTGTISAKQKHMANTALAGAIVFGTFAGRSGEWHRMDRAKVVEKLEGGASALVCGKHKTAKYYGSIAKWVPEGLSKAILTYASLPDKASARLFEPAAGRTDEKKHFHFGPALKAFGKHYAPGYEHPRINLVRKMFHSILLRISREGDDMRLIGEADGHSASMGLHTYALSGPQQDSSVGEKVYRKVFGEPVPWPTQADIAARGRAHGELLDSVAAACEELLSAIADESGDEAMDLVEAACWDKAGGALPLEDAPDGTADSPSAGGSDAAAWALVPVADASAAIGSGRAGEEAATLGGSPPKRHRVCDAPAAAARGRPSAFSLAEKQFIALQCSKFFDHVRTDSAPPLNYVRDDIALAGLAGHEFTVAVDPSNADEFNKFVESVRRVARSWVDYLPAADAD